MKRLVCSVLLATALALPITAGEIQMPPAPPPPACTENCLTAPAQPPILASAWLFVLSVVIPKI